MYPAITLDALPRAGDRDDFVVRVVGPGDTDQTFRLSITRTALRLWDVPAEDAAGALAETLIGQHGTAQAFPEEGFWFDSYSSADTVRETQNRILNLTWRQFLHPAARVSLGAELFTALEQLDEARIAVSGEPLFQALDILFEPTQALEDIDTEVRDNAHFIYRVCILSGIIDRFDFGHESINGLLEWLIPLVGEERARDLVLPFRQVKALRKQYPIHENFEEGVDGERQRRTAIVVAERYFGFRQPTEYAENWHRLLQAFTAAVHELWLAIAGESVLNGKG